MQYETGLIDSASRWQSNANSLSSGGDSSTASPSHVVVLFVLLQDESVLVLSLERKVCVCTGMQSMNVITRR
jgi:hypothetical protein